MGLISVAHAQCQPAWLRGPALPGVLGSVDALTEWDPDGPGPQPPLIVVGGTLQAAGDQVVSGVAAWDGSAWHGLGGGISGTVSSLLVYEGRLIAAGTFSLAGSTPAQNIASFDGVSWSAMGEGLSGGDFNFPTVECLALHNGSLYAGGELSTSGAESLRGVARWDGAAWRNVGGGLGPGFVVVRDLRSNADRLFAGGTFQTSTGAPADNLAQWDGSSWQPVGQGPDDQVSALGTFAGSLVASGSFSTIGGIAARGIARWDGLAWHTLGAGLASGPNSPGPAATLVERQGELIALGASIRTAGSVAALGGAIWNGQAWRDLPGVGDDASQVEDIHAAAIIGSDLVVTGDFRVNDGFVRLGVAAWSGQAWRGLGEGEYTALTDLARIDVAGNPRLFAAGFFTRSDGRGHTGAARWDGFGWVPVVTAMAGNLTIAPDVNSASTGNVLISGLFDVNGVTQARVYRFGGSSPQGFLGGAFYDRLSLPSGPRCFAVYNDQLYAGGHFSTVGTAACRNIAQYVPSLNAWQNVGTGCYFAQLDDTEAVNALEVFDGRLWAGGRFDTAGGLAVQNTARWNGAWAAGSNGFTLVNAMLGNPNPPFPGGEIAVGGNSLNDRLCFILPSLACRTTSRFDGVVNDIATLGNDMIAVGSFTHADAAPTARIARYSGGTAWAPLGTGLGGAGRRAATLGDQVFVAGDFTTAGGQFNAGWARYTTTGTPGGYIQGPGGTIRQGWPATFTVVLTPGFTIASYRWQVQWSDSPTWFEIGADPAADYPYRDEYITFRVRCILTTAAGCEGTIESWTYTELGPCASPDMNCDGNIDMDDVASLIDSIPDGFVCSEQDFNRDGNIDQDDVAALINVIAGGPCP